VIVFALVNRYSHSAGQLSLDRGLYFRVVCLAPNVFSAISPPVVLVSGHIVISYIILCYYSIMQVLPSRVVFLFTYLFKSFFLFTLQRLCIGLSMLFCVLYLVEN
jgi:hypothetical protein